MLSTCSARMFLMLLRFLMMYVEIFQKILETVSHRKYERMFLGRKVLMLQVRFAKMPLERNIGMWIVSPARIFRENTIPTYQ